MQEPYDVLIIGAGPAGSYAARHALELGARVAVVDRARTGGTCTNTGCVPTRVLAITARMLRDIRGATAYGIHTGDPTVIWSETRARVQQVIADVHANKHVEDDIRQAGGDLFLEGSASFVGPNEVRLADSGRTIHANNIILCVGGHSRRLPIPGVEHVMFAEEVLEIEELPSSVVIVGSGYTGVQLTTVLNAFGCQVTLLEVMPTILAGADQEVSEVLADSFRQHGVDVQTSVKGIDRIELLPNGKRQLHYTKDDQAHLVECEAVIMCVGWPASTEGLGLEQAGVKTERGIIPTNQFQQTNVPHIFVAGDANGTGMLVQGAHFEAYIAAHNAVRGPTQPFEHRLLPNGGFTDPDHAAVGLTEREARTEYGDCLIAKAYYRDLDRAIIDNRTTGFLKLVVHPTTRIVLGAHAIGEHAVEVVQAVATAMACGGHVDNLAGIELAYPTYTAIVGAAARQLVPDWGQAAMQAPSPHIVAGGDRRDR